MAWTSRRKRKNTRESAPKLSLRSHLRPLNHYQYLLLPSNNTILCSSTTHYSLHHVELPNPRRTRSKRQSGSSSRSRRASQAALQMDSNDPRRRCHHQRTWPSKRKGYYRGDEQDESESRSQGPGGGHYRSMQQAPSLSAILFPSCLSLGIVLLFQEQNIHSSIRKEKPNRPPNPKLKNRDPSRTKSTTRNPHGRSNQPRPAKKSTSTSTNQTRCNGGPP